MNGGGLYWVVAIFMIVLLYLGVRWAGNQQDTGKSVPVDLNARTGAVQQ